ncbi:MAG TPA: PH domain-containing protein [Chloroflexota bacterium]|jgi:hypothetical protein|nr:PH domain-containing protein [Chloroflexota bacterium]
MFAASPRCAGCGRKTTPDLRTCPDCGHAVLREGDPPVHGAAVAPAPGEARTAPDGPPTGAKIAYDRLDQVEKVQAALLEGETLLAVFDMKGGGTGFLGITDKRLIVYDKAFLRKMKAIVSVPYSRIQTVAAEDESGLLTGRGFFSSSTVVVTTSHGELSFAFRGADKAHVAHDLIVRRLIG